MAINPRKSERKSRGPVVNHGPISTSSIRIGGSDAFRIVCAENPRTRSTSFATSAYAISCGDPITTASAIAPRIETIGMRSMAMKATAIVAPRIVTGSPESARSPNALPRISADFRSAPRSASGISATAVMRL